jgi:thioredoxin reductase (NADPH)
MDKFRARSLRFGTRIIAETMSKIDLSRRPFRYRCEYREGGEPETADTIIMATSARGKRFGPKGEQTYWQSGIPVYAVCDGAVPNFRNKPMAATVVTTSGPSDDEDTARDRERDGNQI